MWIELLGSWSGFLSFVVILLSAVAIPFGVMWALMRKVKGPIELSHEPKASAPAHHSEWHNQRYEH
ncbi:MAG: hypothetical protein V4624_11400 [Pseudomonadota bacterium]|mgnify:FL=1